jgi:uncharacterized 2Fe-2S/4Fe-4S cluster protein (DUF4445 family)
MLTRQYDSATDTTRFFRDGVESDVQSGNVPCLGIAVDIGTTTLVVSLLDLESGRELGTMGALNPQARLGNDVLTRIQIASDRTGLEELHRLLIDELTRLISDVGEKSGINPSVVREIVLTGNTTMLHLATRANPKSLGRYPYTPAERGNRYFTAKDLGLPGGEATAVYLPPVLDGFVGADITVGIIATALHELSGVTLFIDIGTNGEMILAVDGTIIGTSTAAGPAFEGMNITFGMRATLGAIEKVKIDDSGIHVKTIGGSKGIGICGSGLVDAVSELVRVGAVDASGRFARVDQLSPVLARAFRKHDGKPAICLCGAAASSESEVLLTQQDIRQVQLAKGAVRAGIEALLLGQSLDTTQVTRVLLAGSFGAHLQPQSLVGIGLLPEGMVERVVTVGNTSRTGAEALLLDGQARAELVQIVERAKAIDLAHAPGFEKTFVRALAFPKFAEAAE